MAATDHAGPGLCRSALAESVNTERVGEGRRIGCSGSLLRVHRRPRVAVVFLALREGSGGGTPRVASSARARWTRARARSACLPIPGGLARVWAALGTELVMAPYSPASRS